MSRTRHFCPETIFSKTLAPNSAMFYHARDGKQFVTTATAIINTVGSGSVTSIEIDDAGTGYAVNDTINFSNSGTEGVAKEVELGELKVKYNEASLATGNVNNVFDVYPWLQSYLGAYCLGGAGGYQVRVVRG